MSTAYNTVTDYIDDARVLLVDTISPYRYDDPSLLVALNVTLLEARRLRADLFIYATADGKVPSFDQNADQPINIEEQFRLAIVHGIVGHALERDQEDIQDNRATAFLKVFNEILVGVRTTGLAPPQPAGG